MKRSHIFGLIGFGIIPFITIVSIGIITGILILKTLLKPPENKSLKFNLQKPKEGYS